MTYFDLLTIMKREFVVAAYVVDNGKVLLVNHKKLGKWLPVGGHIEPNELPDEALVREVKEETGLDVEIISDDKSPEFNSILNRPFKVVLEDIDDKHQHIDLQYICKIKGKKELRGTDECKWFTTEELNAIENCPPEVKHFAKEAMNLLKIKKITLQMSGLA